jgi:hypothetical protein
MVVQFQEPEYMKKPSTKEYQQVLPPLMTTGIANTMTMTREAMSIENERKLMHNNRSL